LIQSHGDKTPEIHESAFIADNATVVGDVVIGPDASVWFGSVVRGDVHFIRIGARTNVQDLTVIHVDQGKSPAILDEDVTVGHRAILHGCHVKRGSLIGMGAVLLDDVLVEENSLVAAGSVVSPGTVVPAGKLVRGVPARVVRDLTEEEIRSIRRSVESYCGLKNDYLRERRSS
jgi:carbonic anhydrase/acetyltransferase-like protein (isoleucine patch superfamily)